MQTDYRHGSAFWAYNFFGRVRKLDGLVVLVRVAVRILFSLVSYAILNRSSHLFVNRKAKSRSKYGPGALDILWQHAVTGHDRGHMAHNGRRHTPSHIIPSPFRHQQARRGILYLSTRVLMSAMSFEQKYDMGIFTVHKCQLYILHSKVARKSFVSWFIDTLITLFLFFQTTLIFSTLSFVSSTDPFTCISSLAKTIRFRSTSCIPQYNMYDRQITLEFQQQSFIHEIQSAH